MEMQLTLLCSYTEAKSLASIGSAYVTSKGASDSLYKSYFGSTATSKVTTILNAVANESSSSRTYVVLTLFSDPQLTRFLG